MNREIEFRGKCVTDSKYAGEWVTGGYVPMSKGITPNNEGLIMRYLGDETTITYHVDPYTVGQFTGLLDKHGKKIFEGDIVKVYGDANDDTDIGVVKYNEDFGKYVVVYSQVSGNWFDFEGTNGEFLALFCTEVIGNIHDNFDLMK